MWLRALSASYLLGSFSSLIRAKTGSQSPSDVWRSAETLLLPDVQHLLGDNKSLAYQLGTFILETEMLNHRDPEIAKEEDRDPFRFNGPKLDGVTSHRSMLQRFMADTRWKAGLSEAMNEMVSAIGML